MNTVDARFHNLEQEFHELESWSARYQHLVEIGKTLAPLSPEQKSDENRIKGCVSHVWLGAKFQQEKLFFWGDSDAVMPKGLVALSIFLFSEATPTEILLFDTDVLTKLGLRQNLTPTRALAMENMIRRVKELAKRALQKET